MEMQTADRKKTDAGVWESEAKFSAGGALRFEKYERLAQVRLRPPLARLFFELTELHLHVAWAPPPPLTWEAVLPFRRAARCKKLCASTRNRICCQHFERECLRRVLRSGTRGYDFSCPFGVRSFWLAVVLGGQCLGIVFLQLPASGRAGTSSGRQSFRSGTEVARRTRSASSRHQFNLAKGLVQLVAHDVAQSALARVRGNHVEQLSRSVAAHEKLEASLRRALHQVLPFVALKPASRTTESHDEQIVHQMLDYIHRHYREPIGLEAFAKQANMNTAYLSSLFSKTVGLPFRSYLKELRLEKAQALLNDPLRRISETSYAVGYTDPNRFRLDFKEHTGLPPSAWREALAASS